MEVENKLIESPLEEYSVQNKDANAIVQILITIISDCLAIDPTLITYNKLFSEDLGVDSLDQYELIMQIEKKFKITIPDEETEKIHTVGNLLEYLENHVK